MKISIDPDNGLPIFEQLVRQIKYAVARGVLVPGQIIPSTRELSRQLAINPNTVQRAYTALQTENVLEPLRGRGVAVCAGAEQHCRLERKQLLSERFAAVIDEALQSGLSADELRKIFSRHLEKSTR